MSLTILASDPISCSENIAETCILRHKMSRHLLAVGIRVPAERMVRANRLIDPLGILPISRL